MEKEGFGNDAPKGNEERNHELNKCLGVSYAYVEVEGVL
jgi:hypothetical protein